MAFAKAPGAAPLGWAVDNSAALGTAISSVQV